MAFFYASSGLQPCDTSTSRSGSGLERHPSAETRTPRLTQCHTFGAVPRWCWNSWSLADPRSRSTFAGLAAHTYSAAAPPNSMAAPATHAAGACVTTTSATTFRPPSTTAKMSPRLRPAGLGPCAARRLPYRGSLRAPGRNHRIAAHLLLLRRVAGRRLHTRACDVICDVILVP